MLKQFALEEKSITHTTLHKNVLFDIWNSRIKTKILILEFQMLNNMCLCKV